MPTFSMDNQMAAANTDNTTFRAYLTWVRDSILGCGWVQTTDTGQTNPATATAPVTTSTFTATMLFRMDDALQATFPVILKLEFGSAGAIVQPRIRATLGSTTNGAGAFTSNYLAAIFFDGPNSVSLDRCHRMSGAPNRLTFLLFGVYYGVTGYSNSLFFNIERTHIPDGSDNADGVLFIEKNTVNAAHNLRHGVLMPAGVSQIAGTLSNYPMGVLDENVITTTVRGTTAGAYPVFPTCVRPTLPCLNTLAYIHGDFAAFVPASISHFGASRTYLPLGYPNLNSLGRGDTSNNNIAAGLMRWE